MYHLRERRISTLLMESPSVESVWEPSSPGYRTNHNLLVLDVFIPFNSK